MSIRISEENLAVIHRKAEQADMTFTDYVTKACLGKQIVVMTVIESVGTFLVVSLVFSLICIFTGLPVYLPSCSAESPWPQPPRPPCPL